MTLKLSNGNSFTLLSVFVFLVSLSTVYLLRDKIINIPIDRNVPALTVAALFFFAVIAVIYLIIFRNDIFRTKFSLKTIVLLSLFMMLIFTVLSETISRYITAVFVLSAALYSIKNKEFKPHPLFYFMGGYYIFHLIGSAWSIDYNLAFRFLGKGLSFVLLPLAFSCFTPNTEERNKLLKIFFRFLQIYIFMVLIAYLFQIFYHQKDIFTGFGFKKFYFETKVHPGSDFFILLGWGGYDHPTFISFILSFMYGVGFYYWKKEKDSETRITTFELILYTITSAIVIVFLQSRIGMIMLPFGIFLTILMTVRKRKVILFTYIGLAFAAIIFAYFFIYLGHESYFSDPKRVEQTEIMLSYIKEHPWTGTGTGGMRLINTFATGHNQILGDLFHLGIPGLAVFLILATATTYYSLKDRNYMLLYFLLIFFVVMQIDQMLAIQKGLTYFVLFTGLLIRPKFTFAPIEKKPEAH